MAFRLPRQWLVVMITTFKPRQAYIGHRIHALLLHLSLSAKGVPCALNNL